MAAEISAIGKLVVRSSSFPWFRAFSGASLPIVIPRFVPRCGSWCRRQQFIRFGFAIHAATIETMTTEKPNVVFVLGAPGSGKGTQCEKIVEKFGYVHLSAGDLLRAERRKPGSEFGDLIEHHITNGTIVPVAITCSLLQRAMRESGQTHFLIDGFPRNRDNLDGWNREVGDQAKVKAVLFFDCDEKVCVDRCLQRGAAGSGRTDDNEESLRKRFVTYINDTMPIIDIFRTQGLVKQINANRAKEEVFEDVVPVFEEK